MSDIEIQRGIRALLGDEMSSLDNDRIYSLYCKARDVLKERNFSFPRRIHLSYGQGGWSACGTAKNFGDNRFTRETKDVTCQTCKNTTEYKKAVGPGCVRQIIHFSVRKSNSFSTYYQIACDSWSTHHHAPEGENRTVLKTGVTCRNCIRTNYFNL